MADGERGARAGQQALRARIPLTNVYLMESDFEARVARESEALLERSAAAAV